jgi:hypothetical protein
LVARPSSPLGQGMRVTANGHRTEPGMNSLIVPPVARVVLPCSVNERLRSAGQFKGGVSGTPAVVRRMQKGAPCSGCARVRRPGLLGMYVGWIVRRASTATAPQPARLRPS